MGPCPLGSTVEKLASGGKRLWLGVREKRMSLKLPHSSQCCRHSWGPLSGKWEEEHSFPFTPHIKVTWWKMGEGVGDLLKGTGPCSVDLGTELWNSGSLTPREVHVAQTGWFRIT